MLPGFTPLVMLESTAHQPTIGLNFHTLYRGSRTSQGSLSHSDCIDRQCRTHFFEEKLMEKLHWQSRRRRIQLQSIFKPEGYPKTFAEMTQEDKNRISHRARAVMALAKYLGV